MQHFSHQEKFLYSKGLSRLTTTRHHGKIIEHENGELATRMKSDWKGALMQYGICLLYTSPSPRDLSTSRMPSSA